MGEFITSILFTKSTRSSVFSPYHVDYHVSSRLETYPLYPVHHKGQSEARHSEQICADFDVTILHKDIHLMPALTLSWIWLTHEII